MKQLFFLFITIFCCGILILLLSKQSKPKPIPSIVSIIKPNDIEVINLRNKKIRSFYSKIEVSISGQKVNGFLCYEKDKNFRMQLYRNFLELDIGSNDEYFWFWSKRVKNPAIYYARHGSETNLKDALNPVWMMKIFGFQELNGNYYRLKDKIALVQQDKITLIKNNKIIGHYFYKNGSLIVAAEVVQFDGFNPTEMEILYPKENIIINLKFYQNKQNINLKKSLWEIPQGQAINIEI
jgi:hypothetical protein